MAVLREIVDQMGRKQKFQAIVLSVRIPDDKNRNYAGLLKKIFDLRRSVEVYRGTGMALTSFNPATGQGTISKFSIIDLGGDWFDEKGFGPASEEDLKKISIPGNLKPNLVSKPFHIDSDEHLLSVMTYSAGSSISASQVEKFFRNVVSHTDILEEFGAVQIDIFKDSEEIAALLGIKTLKEIKIVISRPNHIMAGLAADIEASLREENADELVRVIKSKDDGYLQPGQQTQALGLLAAENGSVAVRFEEDGTTATANSESKPLIKTVVTDDPEATESGVFRRMRDFFLGIVRANRQKAQDLIEE